MRTKFIAVVAVVGLVAAVAWLVRASKMEAPLELVANEPAVGPDPYVGVARKGLTFLMTAQHADGHWEEKGASAPSRRRRWRGSRSS